MQVGAALLDPDFAKGTLTPEPGYGCGGPPDKSLINIGDPWPLIGR